MKKKPKSRKYKLVACIVLLLVLCWTGSASAQEGRLRFEHLTVQDGLAQNTVNAVLQDRVGFMWFATEEGLNKYDGLSFTHYLHDPENSESLGSSSVLTLYEDSQGRLWVGTEIGLDRFDRETETFFHVLPEEESSVPVYAIVEDNQDRLWVGTAGQGVWVWDAETGIFERFSQNPQESGSLADDYIYDILLGSDGSMWIATAGGLERFDSKGLTFEHHPRDMTNPDSPSSNSVQSLFEDKSGMLWIGTDGGGLNRYDPQRGSFTFYLHSNADRDSIVDNRVLAILEDQEGGLWVGTPYGLDRLDRETGRFSHYRHNPADPETLSSSQIQCLYEDRSGVLWIGTNGGGLSQFKRSAHKFNMYQASPLSPEGLSGSSIGSILEDRNGKLWVGTQEAGLNLLDRETDAWTVYRHDPDNRNSLGSDLISSLLQDSTGNLWIGFYDDGLDRFDASARQFIHSRYQYDNPKSLSSNSVICLAEDGAGNLWIGTLNNGLDRLDPNSGEFIHYRHNPANPSSLSSDEVLVLYTGLDGSLWVGTYDGGLNRWDPESETFQRYLHDPSNSESLGSNQIYSLWEHPQGVLWVGTRDGLDRLELASGLFRHYDAADGLPSNTINGILSDEQGRLWLSTTKGLSRFDPQTETFQNYSVEDGLQSLEFNSRSAFRSRSGELFFGGVEGFNTFFPDEVTDTSTPPPLVITAFEKQNQLAAKDLTGDKPLELSYKDSFISFEFAALDYNAPMKNQYAYQLVGFDPNWIDAGTRNFVSYTNLKGGKYTFHLKAANSDGAWNETGIAVPVIVTPPVWETGWFRVLSVLALAGAVVGGYQWRVSSIQKRNRELEQKVAELSQKVEEAAVAAERNRLARDLHDSVTQSLYSLTLLTEASLRLLEEGEVAESREYQVRTGEIAQQSLQEMRLLVFELRPPELDKIGLVGALEHRLESVERRAGVQAWLIADRDLRLDPLVEQQLYLFVKEALNNALKHAGLYTITVWLGIEGGSLWLEIRDTGRGFDTGKVIDGGLGLVSMRERAKQLGGQLEVNSSPGEGTCVRLSCPLGEERGTQLGS